MKSKRQHARLLAAACWLAGLSADAECTLPQFPQASLPDAEVTVTTALPRMPGNLGEFKVCIDAPVGWTNEVLVAVGMDADGDGSLYDAEIGIVFGLDGGTRYWVCPGTGEYAVGIVETPRAPHWGADGCFHVPKRCWDFDWNMALAVRRGLGDGEAAISWSRTRTPFVVRIR